MNAKELASELLLTPNARVLWDTGKEWVEVLGVKATGHHRNAVTLELVADLGVPSVIVVPEDDHETIRRSR